MAIARHASDAFVNAACIGNAILMLGVDATSKAYLSDLGADILARRFAGRVVTLSSAFSGILTPELAMRMIQSSVNRKLGSARPFSVFPTYAIEWDKQCSEESCHVPIACITRISSLVQLSSASKRIPVRPEVKRNSMQHVVAVRLQCFHKRCVAATMCGKSYPSGATGENSQPEFTEDLLSVIACG
jgi:hypothetical protein